MCVRLGPGAGLYLLIRETESNPLDHSDQTVYLCQTTKLSHNITVKAQWAPHAVEVTWM